MPLSNPVAIDARRSIDGNKMALANIRQRFELAYNSRATVDVETLDDSYSVRLRFPYEERQR